MKRTPRLTTLFLSIAFGLMSVTAWPFIAQTGVSDADDQTRFVKWGATPVEFLVDGGTLAGQDGLPIVYLAMDEWNAVPMAARVAGSIYVADRDFTVDNWGTDWGVIGDTVNEIVFDEDGRVLEGFGLDPAVVAGLGIIVEDTMNQTITDALVVVNGTIPSSPYLDIQGTLTHELGHIWGLAHTFLGAVNTVNREPGSYPVRPEFIPTMYPFENPVDDAFSRSLEHDDMAAVSFLYPETGYDPPERIPYGSSTGTIRGRVWYSGGVPLTAAHVRAVKVGDTNVQVGGLSGFRGDGTGEFEISGLPPGTYHVLVESVDGRDGVTASRIESDGVGACCANPFPELLAGGTWGVAMAQSAWVPRFDIPQLPLKDNDAVELGWPDSFSFAFNGRPCNRLFLYSNGFVSLNRFEDPDPNITLPEADLSDFLSRPVAKIAPFRCDLDPAGNSDKKIDVQGGAESVAVRFQKVPVKSGGTASFTLTMYKSGDFRFDYGTVPQATVIAGYTGGVLDAGGSEAAFPFHTYKGGALPTASRAVLFQLLDGSLLSDGEFYLPRPGSDAFPVRNRFVYPFLSVNKWFNVGLTAVSNSDAASRLRFTAFDMDGNLLPVAQGRANPVETTLGPYAQTALQADQLFGFPADVDGWVLLETDNPDPYGIQGFFLAESFFNNRLDSLDGAVAMSDASRSVIFPRYAGEKGEFTDVTLVNPNPVSNAVTLSLYFDDGAEKKFQDVIPPNGCAFFRMGDPGSAWLFAEGERPISGFAMNFNEAGSLAGQASTFVWEARELAVSPYFVNLEGQYASKIDLVNPNDAQTSANVTLFDGQNRQVGRTVSATIKPWYHSRLDLSPESFGYPVSGTTAGWVKVEADRPVVGAVTVGDPQYKFYQTTLPLCWQPLYYTLFSHVAQGTVSGVPFLTGVAMLSLENANPVEFGVYDSQGNSRYASSFSAGAGDSRAAMLDQWMPQGPWPQVGGYLTAESGKGAFAYEIFATGDSAFYAAVPAQKYLPIQYEDRDDENGWWQTPSVLGRFPVEVRGRVAPGDTGYFIMDLGDGFTDIIEDLYTFPVPKAGRYLIALYPDNRYSDMDITLFDSSWKVVASATNGVPGAEYLEVDLRQENYYIGASLLDIGWFRDMGYWLTVEPNGIN